MTSHARVCVRIGARTCVLLNARSTFLRFCANFRVFKLSFLKTSSGEMLIKNAVLPVPPRELCSKRVNVLFLNGTCLFFSASALMQFPNCDSEELMLSVSFFTWCHPLSCSMNKAAFAIEPNNKPDAPNPPALKKKYTHTNPAQLN